MEIGKSVAVCCVWRAVDGLIESNLDVRGTISSMTPTRAHVLIPCIRS